MSTSMTDPGVAVHPVEDRHESASTAEVSGEDIAALRGAVLILARRLRHQQAGDELSPSESAVMGRVGRAGPMTPGQLAKSEHVQPPSMTRIIERLGYGVAVAQDGVEGLAMARSYRPELVLTDAMMPKLDGREMGRLIKDDPELTGTKVVVITSLYTDSRYKH